MASARWLVVAICAACGGNSDTPTDAANDSNAADSGAGNARLFGIDPSTAAGESFADALGVAKTAGVTMLPQHIDWRGIEAGPDDSFAWNALDTKKWDVTGTGFAADGDAHVLRYRTTAARDGDFLRARYTLDGALTTALDASIAPTDGAQATLMLRFDSAAGNRCSAATDHFVAIVLTASANGTAAAAATCQSGSFHSEGVIASGAAANLRIRRTATQLVVERAVNDAATTVATLALTSLPAAFGGAARVHVFAGNPKAASDATLAHLRAGGTAHWDQAKDRFVGDPAFDIPAALQAVHGPTHMPLLITLRTINTVATELPSDLQGAIDPSTQRIDLSRPEVRARYREAIDYLLSAMPDVRIAGFSIGNEIDGYLGDSATAWAQTAAFADDALPYLRGKLAANTPIGITATADGLRAHAAQMAAVNAHATAAFITYYPLAPNFAARDPHDVMGDVAAVIAATALPVLFTEAGYPSAAASASCPACTGSEAKQAMFFEQLFAAWDAQPRMLGFSASWLSDAPDSKLAEWRDYYHVSDPTFLSYLASLGLRTHTGAAKPAWITLADAAHMHRF